MDWITAGELAKSKVPATKQQTVFTYESNQSITTHLERYYKYIRYLNLINQLISPAKNVILMPDRSWPGLTKTASGTVVQQGAAGKYATVGQRRKRGGKHVRDKHKRRMGRKMEVKVGTLNVGTMTGKGR